MVFLQEAPGQPFVHNGTVHAPDIEMAMQNARDVFVRRPEAAALWVVPAEEIYSRTREELANQPAGEPSDQPTSGLEDYYVFGKLTEQAQASELGEVIAPSSTEALQAALEKFKDKAVLRWYIFPASAVGKSDPADAASMFAPARDKTYKDQAEYPVVTMMRQIRAKGRPKDE